MAESMPLVDEDDEATWKRITARSRRLLLLGWGYYCCYGAITGLFLL
jgi:hypothetical protein